MTLLACSLVPSFPPHFPPFHQAVLKCYRMALQGIGKRYSRVKKGGEKAHKSKLMNAILEKLPSFAPFSIVATDSVFTGTPSHSHAKIAPLTKKKTCLSFLPMKEESPSKIHTI
uniref:Uncharacterized protein n=1 Tax=Sphaerodactylus townsendi TaxID=933632 RepID=A0ACB8EI98_9SAUR